MGLRHWTYRPERRGYHLIDDDSGEELTWIARDAVEANSETSLESMLRRDLADGADTAYSHLCQLHTHLEGHPQLLDEEVELSPFGDW